ncbi:MAG: hypothetical protein ABEI99_11190, partial [Halobaculum sp.]
RRDVLGGALDSPRLGFRPARPLEVSVAVLTRWLGARTVPDAVGLVVILGYYYLLAVAVAGLIRRGRVLLG